MLIVIGCGNRKGTRPAPARDLYTGHHFRHCLHWALACSTPNDRVVILSARYGFLDLDDTVAPYETTWKSPDAITRTRLWRTAECRGLLAERDVVTTAGTAYLRRIRTIWPRARSIFEHLPDKRIGFREQLLTHLIRQCSRSRSSSVSVRPTS